MSEERPPVSLELEWREGQRFEGRSGSVSLTLDGDGLAGPTPVQALAFALAGCMAIDVVHVLTRGRTPPVALAARLVAQRAETEPRRLLRVALHFSVTGEAPPDRVERAVALSREKYCSVWHSLRADIELATSFEVSRRRA